MELQWINALQSLSTPFWDRFFIGVTMLGEEYFYILVLGFFYWCINKEEVRYLVMVITFSSVLNGALKEIVNSPRPFMVEEVRALRTETAHGFSFPSGHVQIVASFYGALAHRYKKVWLWLVAFVVVILVGLSRVYLGVHWPRDVIGGIIFAALSVFIISRIEVHEKKQGVSWPYFVLFALVVSSMLLLKSETYIKATGAFLGFMMGYLVEDYYVKFDVRNGLFGQILKFILGIALTLAIFEGLKAVLPGSNLYVFIRYFATIFSVAAVIPWIYTKIGLSRRHMFI